MLLGGCVEGPSTGAAACERPPCLNINLNVVKSCKVDHDPVVTGGKAGKAVCTAAYRDRSTFASSKTDRSRHIFGGVRSYDQCRPLVDCPVPNAACRLIVGISGTDHRAGHADVQFSDRRLAEYASHDVRRRPEVMPAGYGVRLCRSFAQPPSPATPPVSFLAMPAHS